jgi:catalase
MDGFGVHAFKFVNAKGEVNYVKFHWKSRQGLQGIAGKDVPKSLGADWNLMSNDLYNAIKAHDNPQWDLYVQVISPKDLDKLNFDFDPLDDTKVWPASIAERKVGTMTLNRIPDNYFESTEESAFAPSRLVPGIEPSEDRMLQGRLFAYADTQMYRLGANYNELPINRPLAAVSNNNQDGSMNIGDRKGEVNYEPSGINELSQPAKYKYVQTPLTGMTQQTAIHKTLNFRQAGEYYRSLPEMGKQELISNLSSDLNHVTDDSNKYAMISYFYKADADYGTRLASATHADVSRVKAAAAKLIEN